ncbi:MAG: polyprenyl synthetase family protein [Desulfobacterales bacterium]|jgi:geranylgeranyl diphosphate synthase, type II|nr:polyprenyl synthetase family protein [Desulfobacteraceae bacterium]MBT4365604.1 polyprenyl synthetase family protein [Desulfobacteraceae bacterium]MBT7087021.1 polyprenyl synthetase family protein [Desulfobacterales bacterium]MBT7697093.1 polyprenyl synthetase family protein [Desulfobacterales bacterium]
MFDLNSYLLSKRKIINEYIERILNSSSESTPIVSAMKYSLMAGGKRLRPILCMSAAEAVGEKSDIILPVACALEMIHTYSLIHDDLPSMDNDNMRRGKPTSHINFDESTAILAGDALLTLAFKILSSSEIKNNDYKNMLKISGIIADAAGYKGMIEGQMLDISSEGKVLSIEELGKMHYLKTGALIEASIYSGAIIGGGTNEQVESLRIYAGKIGLAFQVADDILNVDGDPEVMGKAVGSDINRNKSTYPSVIGLEKSKKIAEDLVYSALKAIDTFDNKAEPLRLIARYIIERDK